MLKFLEDIPKSNLAGKQILLRVDFEVPLEGSVVKDDFRIRAVLPTINYLLGAGARILLLTKRGHLGVNDGYRASTEHLIPHLEKLLGQKIRFIPNLSSLKTFSESVGQNQIFLFENLRSWPEEEENSASFAKKFADEADLYVSDNFGTAHRAHASVASIPRFLPSYVGFLLKKEMDSLGRVAENPARPVVAIMGGAKLETKLPLIKKFIDAGDKVLLGGKIANSILWAKGMKAESEHCVEDISDFIKNLNLSSPDLHLPTDGFSARDPSAETHLLKLEEIPEDECVFDVGPETVRSFIRILREAATIIWNGPLGETEQERFSQGTFALVRGLAGIQAYKVAGGGDLISALEQKNLLVGFDHVSTGGGAMLKFLAGEKLPGIEALKDNF